MTGRIGVDGFVIRHLQDSGPSDITCSWAASKSSTRRSRWICCGGVPSDGIAESRRRDTNRVAHRLSDV